MLSSRIGAGVLGGLIAGLVFGVMMHMTIVTTPAGDRVPMMAMIAQTIGSPSLAVGWIFHLFNSALFGAIFGLLVGLRTMVSTASAVGVGAAYGIALWIVGGLILMPLMLGMAAFAPLIMSVLHFAAAVSFIGHLVYGVILGALFPMLVPRLIGSSI